MRDDGGHPLVERSGRGLGVRVFTARPDIPVDPEGRVHPGTGGMSVSPYDARNLPDHRRPPELDDGEGPDPIWYLYIEELGETLSFRPDPKKPTHGFVEPGDVMLLVAYEAALAGTRMTWRFFNV
jgi:hypothetical protein